MGNLLDRLVSGGITLSGKLCRFCIWKPLDEGA
jgi:hypothetical protein